MMGLSFKGHKQSALQHPLREMHFSFRPCHFLPGKPKVMTWSLRGPSRTEAEHP